MKEDEQLQPSLRLVAGVVFIFGFALLAGALVAPHAFNLMVYLGRQSDALVGLRSTEFEKVANRCVLIALLAALVPALRFAGMARWDRLGLKRTTGWKMQLLRGWTVGVVTMLVLLGVGWATKSYYLLPGRFTAEVLGKVLGYLVGALVVGVIEEALFRGAVFGMLRACFGLWIGAIVASLLFASVHFASPEPPVGVVYGHWDTGLRMLRYMFTPIDVRWSYGFMFITLFAMGMTLCLLYARQRTLYFVIGLHAGWVWIMRIGGYFLERDNDVMLTLFGPSMSVAKSLMSSLIMVGFFVWAASRLSSRKVENHGGQTADAA